MISSDLLAYDIAHKERRVFLLLFVSCTGAGICVELFPLLDLLSMSTCAQKDEITYSCSLPSFSSSTATLAALVTFDSINALLAGILLPPVKSLIFARMNGVLA